MFYFLQAYDDNESSVRKASVFCLVGIYMIVGEPLRPHLSDLNGSKVGIIRQSTVKPVLLSDHSKKDQKFGFQDRLLPECSLGAFCNTFDLH